MNNIKLNEKNILLLDMSLLNDYDYNRLLDIISENKPNEADIFFLEKLGLLEIEVD